MLCGTVSEILVVGFKLFQSENLDLMVYWERELKSVENHRGECCIRYIHILWRVLLLWVMSYNVLFFRWGRICRYWAPGGTGSGGLPKICRRGWRTSRRSREPCSTGWTGSFREWRAWPSRGQRGKLSSTSAPWRWAKTKNLTNKLVFVSVTPAVQTLQCIVMLKQERAFPKLLPQSWKHTFIERISLFVAALSRIQTHSFECRRRNQIKNAGLSGKNVDSGSFFHSGSDRAVISFHTILETQYYKLLCSAVTSDKPSNSKICYSKWISWVVLRHLTCTAIRSKAR